MTSLIFEKKGVMGLARQIILQKNEVVVQYCQQGSLISEVKTRLKNPTQARVYFEKMSDNFRDAGFNELDNESGGLIGTVAYIDGATGLGRIRADALGDVLFESKNDSAQKLKQGQRVLVLGVKRKSKSKLPFMFNSPWVATEVHTLRAHKKHSKKELSVGACKKMIQEAGDSLKGFQTQKKFKKPFKVGQIVYGYYPGIYRIVEIKGPMVKCEEIYNAKLVRAGGAVHSWLATFCRPQSIIK